jgi:hypothetical protein
VGERQGDNNAGRVPDRVTVNEAATLLGVHRNTVYSRVRVGMYDAEKVLTERGPTWMIDRDSLTTNAPTTERQQHVSGVPALQQEALQELARQIVKEAGLQQKSDAGKRGRERYIEAGREFGKTQTDFFKHIGTLSAATVVAVPAVIKGVIKDPEMVLVYSSMGLLLLPVFLSFLGLSAASGLLSNFAWGFSPDTGEDANRHVLRLSRFYDYFRLAVYLIYATGLVFFFWLLVH